MTSYGILINLNEPLDNYE